jgi:hypothetical protein
MCLIVFSEMIFIGVLFFFMYTLRLESCRRTTNPLFLRFLSTSIDPKLPFVAFFIQSRFFYNSSCLFMLYQLFSKGGAILLLLCITITGRK